MRYAYLGDSGYVTDMKWNLMDWTNETKDFSMDFSMKLMRFLFRTVQQPVPEVKQNRADAYGLHSYQLLMLAAIPVYEL